MVTIQIYSSGTVQTISPANWSLEFGIKPTYKCARNPTYLGLQNNGGIQSNMVFKICDGISCSSFYVEEFDVIIHKKKSSLYKPIKLLSILHPKPQANLVVGVGTRHTHQILLVNSD